MAAAVAASVCALVLACAAALAPAQQGGGAGEKQAGKDRTGEADATGEPGRGRAQGSGTGQGTAGGGAAPSRGPALRARAWVLIDALDGDVLAAKAPRRRLLIASATKLMTAYAALRQLKPDQRLTAPAYDALPAESLLGLRRGESMTVRDLLYALILVSANDAAATLAVGIDGSVDGFVGRMNRLADSLALADTSFANPIGLDDPDNFSSASDLATLARKLLRNRLFAKIADTERRVVRSGDEPRRLDTRNTLLLKDDSVTGVKTGHTNRAGYVLVGSAARGSTNLISVVLGAPSESARDSESAKLLDYGFSLYRPRVAVAKGEELAAAALDFRDEELELVAARRVVVTVREGDRIDTRVSAPEEVTGEVGRAERLGTVTVTVDGAPAAEVPLVAARAVEAASVVDRVRSATPLGLLVLPAGLIVIVIAGLLGRAARRSGRSEEPVGTPRRTPEERRAMHEQRMRDRGEEAEEE